MIGELFGRRIRVRVGNQIVCDLSPFDSLTANEDRNLHVDFQTEKHTKIDPLQTTVTIYGLSRTTRDRMSIELDAANQVAWKIRRAIQSGAVDVLLGSEEAVLSSLIVQGAQIQIDAGYGLDLGTLSVCTILPDGLKHSRDGTGWATEITAQDNRFLWQDGFVSASVAGGVSLYDYQRVIDASTAVLAGEESIAAFTAAFPELTIIKDIPGHKNGFVLHGEAQRQTRQLCDVLGLQPYINELGELAYLDPLATRAALAVRLAPSSGLLNIESVGRGYYTARSLLNHRLSPGMQVLLFDAIDPLLPLVETPVGLGVYRVDHVTHSGSSYSDPYYSDIALRPTGIPPALNP